MNNPKIVAAISAIAVIYLGYSMFGAQEEAASSALNTLNWVFLLLAILALIGSIVLMAKGGRT